MEQLAGVVTDVNRQSLTWGAQPQASSVGRVRLPAGPVWTTGISKQDTQTGAPDRVLGWCWVAPMTVPVTKVTVEEDGMVRLVMENLFTDWLLDVIGCLM